MRFLRLELQGFKSYDSLDLDLSEVEHAAVCGRNGTGKSTLVEAIAWALYGEGSADDLVAQGAKSAGVTVTFSLEGETYRVSRGRDRGKKSWLVLEHEDPDEQPSLITGQWVSLSQPKIADTERELERIVGMNAEAFRASLYSAQGAVASLIEMRAGERKALLGSLLGLDRYEEWREEASREARQMAAQAQAAEAAEMALSQQLPALREKILPDPSTALAEAEKLAAGLRIREAELTASIARQQAAEQVKRRVALLAQMDKLEADAVAAEARNAQRASLRETIAAMAGDAEGLAAMERLREDYVERKAKAKAEADELASRAALIESTIHTQRTRANEAARLAQGLSEKATALREKAKAPHEAAELCPTCGQRLDVEAHSRVVAMLEQQALEFESEIREALAAEEAARLEVQRWQADLEKLPVAAPEGGRVPREPVEVALGGYDPARHAQLREVSDQLGKHQGHLDGIGPEDEDVEAFRVQWREIRAEAAELPKHVDDGPLPDEIRALIATEQASVQDARQRLRDHEQALAHLAKIEAEIEEHFASRGVILARQRALETCARAFSRDGVPAMILDSSVGAIEEAANRALEQLGSSMRVTLATQREKKTGGIAETLDIVVDDGVFERSISTYSGGEVYRVAIALRLAIAEALAGRAIESLIIDEVTDLDADGVGALVEILAGLDKQVILVSHSQEEIAAMPQVLVVSRDGPQAPSQVALR